MTNRFVIDTNVLISALLFKSSAPLEILTPDLFIDKFA